MTKPALGVLIAEDHGVVAEGIVAVVHQIPGLLVAGQVTAVSEIAPALVRLDPAVLLLDLHLRREPSWPYCPEFKRLSPQLRIIGISALPPPPAAQLVLDEFVIKGDLGRALPALLRPPDGFVSLARAPHSPFITRFAAHASQEARNYLHNLRTALDRRDGPLALSFAHALKNIADLIGPAALCDACQRLHDRIQQGDWVAASREWTDLDRQLASARDRLPDSP